MKREEAKEILSKKVKPCVLGEWGEAIDTAIEALSAENPKADERIIQSGDLISRQDVVSEIHKYFVEEIDKTPTEIDEDGDEIYTDMPTVNSLLACNKELSKRIKSLPSADRPRGEWQDKEVFNETDDDHIVDEWQSARCSVCGKYHTTPYMYYFDNFNYCPNCGAKMKTI